MSTRPVSRKARTKAKPLAANSFTKAMASSEAPADFMASRKQASCCAGSPSVHFRRISESCSGVGVHADFAVMRGVESGAGAARPSGRANGTNQLNVAQHTATAVKIARVIFVSGASRIRKHRTRLALLKLLGTAAGYEDPRGRREIHIFLL